MNLLMSLLRVVGMRARGKHNYAIVSAQAGMGQQCQRTANTSAIPNHKAQVQCAKGNLSSKALEATGCIESNSLVICSWPDGVCQMNK